MRFPVKEPYRITNPFNLAYHPGIDIAPGTSGQTGVGCYAPEDCTVVGFGYVPTYEGRYLVLKSNKKNIWYYFGHFAEQKVKIGQSVKEGQLIGILGMTGLADGIHTHHEVRQTRSGNQINPIKYYEPKAPRITRKLTWTRKRLYELTEDTYIASIPSNKKAGTILHKKGEKFDIGEYTEWSSGKRFYRTKKQVANKDMRGYGKSKLRRIK